VRPISVLNYNQRTGGVGLKNQLLHSYPIEIKRTNRGYMKLPRGLFNTSILNAMIINIQREQREKKRSGVIQNSVS
jgi:hypothetical protein